MFKLVHYVTHASVSKRAVGIRLKCLLVFQRTRFSLTTARLLKTETQQKEFVVLDGPRGFYLLRSVLVKCKASAGKLRLLFYA